jgi:FkbM family methyltransferase
MPTLQGAIARLKKPFEPNIERDRYNWLRRYVTQKHGVFVEAGANDGVTQSNTLYFEKAGWTGLLIEPIPSLAQKCRIARSSPVEECALVAPEMAGQSVGMTYANLMSLVDGAMGSGHGDEMHLHAARPHLPEGEEFYRIDVPGRTLSDVLDANRLSAVDLLSLDLEGFEAPALRGLDFMRHQPTWMLIEARFREEVEAVIGNRYEAVAQSGDYDVLYRYRRIG